VKAEGHRLKNVYFLAIEAHCKVKYPLCIITT